MSIDPFPQVRLTCRSCFRPFILYSETITHRPPGPGDPTDWSLHSVALGQDSQRLYFTPTSRIPCGVTTSVVDGEISDLDHNVQILDSESSDTHPVTVHDLSMFLRLDEERDGGSKDFGKRHRGETEGVGGFSEVPGFKGHRRRSG